ncbi:unnamed protein product [Ambrosiozyma monospora]|uniref:Unnamed protein product n=1 Tax=Ambrosiozyma monospora TaxID=43982 RepID=A0ACB5U9T2_AMBMO|nr:unnamed protein product [Ambrosiozyma monospora]
MTLVIRGPQSLNYLQKLAVASFSDISSHSSNKLFVSLKSKKLGHTEIKNSLSEFNIGSDVWKPKYQVEPYGPTELRRAIHIENDTKTPVLRMLFPIPTAIVSKLSPKELSLYISSWCSIFGDESDTSINSTLFKLGYIGIGS